MPTVNKRMHHALTEQDKESAKISLIQYMIQEDLTPAETAADQYLIEQLLPYLAKQNPEWQGVSSDVEFKASEVHYRLLTFLKNQLRNGGRYIKKRYDETKHSASQADQSDDSDEEQPTPKKSISRTKLEKRARIEQPKEDQEDGTTDPPTKKQKLIMASIDTQNDPEEKPNQKKHQYSSEEEFNMAETFAEMRRLAGSMRAHKRSIHEMHKKWQELAAKIKPELDDPLANLE